jgi:NAD(P)-dependent dehydrogenase (short-subunit alcohol dehydrogenase family)
MKRILVTGTSRGIGKSIALKLLKDGHFVYGISRSISPFNHENYYHISVDLIQPNAFSLVKSHIKEKLYSIIHNAGVLIIKKIGDMEIEDYEHLMKLNVTFGIELIRNYLPDLRKCKGSIILVSSGAATMGYQGWGAYCISKASVNMLAEVLGIEEPLVCTVAVRPGVVDTQMQEEIRIAGSEQMEKEKYNKFVTLKNQGGLIDPDKPGFAIANFAVNPNMELSGKFVNWDSI